MRGVLLGLMATVAGVLLFSFPEGLAQAKVQLPAILKSSSMAVSGAGRLLVAARR